MPLPELPAPWTIPGYGACRTTRSYSTRPCSSGRHSHASVPVQLWMWGAGLKRIAGTALCMQVWGLALEHGRFNRQYNNTRTSQLSRCPKCLTFQ